MHILDVYMQSFKGPSFEQLPLGELIWLQGTSRSGLLIARLELYLQASYNLVNST